MLFVLLRQRFLSARNVVIEAFRQRPAVAGLIAIAGAVVFGTVLLGFTYFFDVASQVHQLDEAVRQVFFFLFLFLIAGSVPFVASALLFAKDYTLLFASPAHPRSLIAARLLDAAVANAVQFLALGLPAMVAATYVSHNSAAGWALLPVIVSAYVLLPACITAVLLCALIAVIGSRRLRACIGILNAILAISVCFTMVAEAQQFPAAALARGEGLTTASAAPDYHSAMASKAPSALFADAVLASGSGGDPSTLWISLARALSLVLVIGLLAVFLGARTISPEALVDQEARVTGALAGRTGRQPRRRSVLGALIGKDVMLSSRDAILKSQLAMPMILYLVPFPVAARARPGLPHGALLPFLLAMTAVVVFMQTSILSLTSLGLEGQSFWLLLAAPIRASMVVRSKVLLSTAVTGGAGLALCGITTAVCPGSTHTVAVAAVFIAVAASTLCCLGVGLSAMMPRFAYENPAHRVSAWALILGFLGSSGYLLISGVLFGTAWFVATSPAFRDVTGWVYAGAVLVFCAMTVTLAAMPVVLGSRRLNGYEWNHS
ncbi:MAG: hypothetical protein KGJ62_06890 [Armatimonadetes bacterium]|nr:hypothetical protein [Armatimonadota bacterium]MDE2206261.1 hypothetical protein [Armatimonadota bacterium]